MKKAVLAALGLGLGSVLTGMTMPVAHAEEFTLDPVVVTAGRVPTTITESRADISVVTRKQLEDQKITNVEEALRTVPGVQFLNYGFNGMNANLSGIRINGSNDIIILVDGVRVTDFRSQHSSGYFYSSLLNNINNIERIEVLRGGAGVVYGNGGRGGVINIITRKIDGQNSQIDLGVGNFGKRTLGLTTQGNKNKLSYRAYYNDERRGDAKDGDSNILPGSMTNRSGGVKLVYHFDEAHQHDLSFAYDKQKSDYSGRDGIYRNNFSGYYRSQMYTLQHNYKMNDHWSHQLTWRHSAIKTAYGQLYDRPGSKPYALKSDYDYDFINEQVNYTDAHNTLIFGIDYSYGKTNKPYTEPVGKTFVSYHPEMRNYSFYLQEDWRPTEKWLLSYGIRHDRPRGDEFSADFSSHTSQSFKVGYDLTPNDLFYVSRNDFYILPSLETRFDKEHGGDKLLPSYGYTWNVGYSRKFNENNVVTLNWFKTLGKRTMGYSVGENIGTDPGDWQYKNVDNTVDRGWNAQWMVQLNDHWSADLGWAHLFHYANGDNFERGYYPKDKATFGLNYDNAKWHAGLNGFYFIRRPSTQERDRKYKGWPHDKYAVINLNLAYSPNKSTTVYMKVENLFDVLWAEHTDVIHNHAPETWYSMPGRAWTMGVQYRF